jgi:hypothetical protein
MASSREELRVGMEVEVEWQGAWWPGKVLEIAKEQVPAGDAPSSSNDKSVRIEYASNLSQKEEEWVSFGRIRRKDSPKASLVRSYMFRKNQCSLLHASFECKPALKRHGATKAHMHAA